MTLLYRAGYRNALQHFTKVAGRLEDAIAEGLISYDDLAPETRGLPDIMRKKLLRNQFHEPSAVAPEALARKRELADRLYQAQMKQPALVSAPSVRAKSEMLPGMGPATHMNTVYAPETSGQFLRSAQDGILGQARALKSTIPEPRAAALRLPEFLDKALALPARTGVDSTLTHAVFQHELGEGAEMYRMGRGQPVYPHASHLGVEPILRENLTSMGDPEAVQTFRQLRQMHPDDAQVQRLLRGVGHTPDHPVPIGGRQQRAVERVLGNAANLTPSSRTRAVQIAAAGGNVPAVPAEIAQQSKQVSGDLLKFLGDVKKQPALDSFKQLRGMRETFKPLTQFVRKGI